jgi:hypothetical protein
LLAIERRERKYHAWRMSSTFARKPERHFAFLAQYFLKKQFKVKGSIMSGLHSLGGGLTTQQAAELAASYALVGKTAKVYDITAYGAVADGGGTTYTDNTTAVNNAIAAAIAAGGGVVYVPKGIFTCDGPLLIPNAANTDAGLNWKRQKPLRITGESQDCKGILYGGAMNGGAELDLRYGATPDGTHIAKIDTRGEGFLEIDHLALVDNGTSAYPFVFDSATTLYIHDCYIRGNPVSMNGTMASPCPTQDFAIFGQQVSLSPALAASNNIFQGYGTVLERNFYDYIRRGSTFQNAANSIRCVNETFSAKCGGADTYAAPYYFDPSYDSGLTGAQQWDDINHECMGCTVSGALVEVIHYKYFAVLMHKAARNVFVGNQLWDNASDGTVTVAHYYTDTNARYNVFVNGFNDNGSIPPLAGPGIGYQNWYGTGEIGNITNLQSLMVAATQAATPKSLMQVGSPLGSSVTTPRAFGVYDPNETTGNRGNFGVYSTDTAAINKGGMISLGGENSVSGGSTPFPYVTLKGVSKVAGSYAGGLEICTAMDESSGSGNMLKWLTLSNSGLLEVGLRSSAGSGTSVGDRANFYSPDDTSYGHSNGNVGIFTTDTAAVGKGGQLTLGGKVSGAGPYIMAGLRGEKAVADSTYKGQLVVLTVDHDSEVRRSAIFGWDASLTLQYYTDDESTKRGGHLNLNSVQTTVNGSAAGTQITSMPFQGTAYKKVVIEWNAFNDAGNTITFPVAFHQAPVVTANSTTAANPTLSTTQAVMPATSGAKSGWVILEGY